MNILLINPYIHDFAAYDLWMRPHGLLKIAAVLEKLGCDIAFINCLDRKDPDIYKFYKRKRPRDDAYDCGKFPKTQIEKPAQLKNVPRRYFRYGIPVELFEQRLKEIKNPDLILVTSGMTYWYPGVAETIGIVRKHFPKSQVVLGGVYPTLCPEHATKYSGANTVFGGSNLSELFKLIEKVTGNRLKNFEKIFRILSPSAYHLLKNNNAAAIQTSFGCPFACTYCASKLIEPRFTQRSIDEITAELSYYRSLGIKNIAFYDDALLFDAENHFVPLMERVIAEGFNFYFHTPNGLHARYITPKTASLIKSAGFKTIRLSLETTSPQTQREIGNKVSNEDFKRAIVCLKEAGISPDEIDVYLLLGFPGQTLEDARRDMNFVHSLGAKIILASYSAIQGTADWNKMVSEKKIAADMDPLWHNHTIFPSVNGKFTVETVRRLRQEAAVLNKLLLF